MEGEKEEARSGRDGGRGETSKWNGVSTVVKP